ncbi:DUF362 domain-containing protein [Puniceicoccus vermicola]|uniref:DUF362 domain-containing protein n=1 Tax=Puniceicoccus vermicola TaxID=388746 RepID=A0A7X1AVQ3_9BACT|nr:DUF362 domain-containing protein [Puniceicoccus vermicola]MBC2600707.1 DUF362 domain-containing protein [Puniceicoccus vermicola]
MSHRKLSIAFTLLLLLGFAVSQAQPLKTEEPAFIYASPDAHTTPDYQKVIPLLLAEWEAAYQPIRPGSTGRVVLKVYTNSGMGLRTPPGLVLALADALVERGFARENITIADLDTRRLRASGYLPALSDGGATFHGMPVISLDNPKYHLKDWFYESPLPPHPLLKGAEEGKNLELLEGDEDRKSFLPAPLLFNLDFWINLPVAFHHPILGMSGATANAGVWSVSNQSRFFSRPVSAASSTVEIAAIPELQRSWLFSIMSLEAYQIIGGPRFNSYYTQSRPEVILSADPLLIDRYALAAINASRIQRGFDPISPDPLFFRYGESLDLGSANLDSTRLKSVQ